MSTFIFSWTKQGPHNTLTSFTPSCFLCCVVVYSNSPYIFNLPKTSLLFFYQSMFISISLFTTPSGTFHAFFLASPCRYLGYFFSAVRRIPLRFFLYASTNNKCSVFVWKHLCFSWSDKELAVGGAFSFSISSLVSIGRSTVSLIII